VDRLSMLPSAGVRPGFFRNGAGLSTGEAAQQAPLFLSFMTLSAESTPAATAAVFLYLFRIEKAVQ
jgi:hypothetical protein